MPDLNVYTFKDDSNNTFVFTAPSKSQAMKSAKRIHGNRVLRFESERPETSEERVERIRRGKARREKQKREEAMQPKILRRRKAFGRNDRCPCGSGRKVKHCRCSRD